LKKSISLKSGLLPGVLIFVGVCVVSLRSVFYMQPERLQGEVYKILYLHVPSAFCAFTCAFIMFVLSIVYLKNRKIICLNIARACAEVGLIFTVATLVTGSIWGKTTWGTWWTWDARLTTTFVLGLLYCGYLMLWLTISDVEKKGVLCSVLGIFIFCDVPIIYKSVVWWRTLHQPPSLFSGEGNTMSTVIYHQLIISIIAFIALSLWLIWQRAQNIALQNTMESKANRFF